MSKMATLKPKKGSRQRRKLLGRGDGSGKGGTSGKGHKGQKARSGGSIRWGFEGGQMPLARRNPKFGFTNHGFRTRYAAINLSDLEKFDGEVTPQALVDAGRVGKKDLVKILGRGELSKSLTVKAHKASESAKAAIEKAGGSFEAIPAKKAKAEAATEKQN
jgi:large subunit ribosomal protein L15